MWHIGASVCKSALVTCTKCIRANHLRSRFHSYGERGSAHEAAVLQWAPVAPGDGERPTGLRRGYGVQLARTVMPDSNNSASSLSATALSVSPSSSPSAATRTAPSSHAANYDTIVLQAVPDDMVDQVNAVLRESGHLLHHLQLLRCWKTSEELKHDATYASLHAYALRSLALALQLKSGLVTASSANSNELDDVDGAVKAEPGLAPPRSTVAGLPLQLQHTIRALTAVLK